MTRWPEPIPEPDTDENIGKTSCPGNPLALIGLPIGMYHCQYCGAMVIAGLHHPTDEGVREQGVTPYGELECCAGEPRTHEVCSECGCSEIGNGSHVCTRHYDLINRRKGHERS